MMRIVGLSGNTLFIQFHTDDGWIQTRVTEEEFHRMMDFFYPDYIDDWIQGFNGSNHIDPENMPSFAEFFYNYGEDPDMRSRGDSYIFRTNNLN